MEFSKCLILKVQSMSQYIVFFHCFLFMSFRANGLNSTQRIAIKHVKELNLWFKRENIGVSANSDRLAITTGFRIYHRCIVHFVMPMTRK